MNRLTLAALCAVALPLHAQQPFPTKPIQVVSTASPGSSGDAALRLMAVKMGQTLGQPVVVEVRTAARGAEAARALAKAEPDGHTITFGTSGTYVNGRFLFKNMAFDVLKDYIPISLSYSAPSFLGVAADFPANNLKEFIAYAKANPGKIAYASSGVGSVFHLAGESLKVAAGIDMLHVPYAQANFSQMVTDWVSGRVQVYFPTWAFIRPNLPKVKAIALVDHKRSKYLPDVATVGETIPGFVPFAAWWAFFGPAGMPADRAERIASASRNALEQKDVLEKLEPLGLNPIGSTPQELGVHLRRELEAVGKVVKAAGIQPE